MYRERQENQWERNRPMPLRSVLDHGLLRRRRLTERMQHLAEVVPRDRLMDAEPFRLLRRTPVGAEEDVHERRDVRVVAGEAVLVMMPMMKLRCTDEPTQRTDRQTHVAVDV